VFPVSAAFGDESIETGDRENMGEFRAVSKDRIRPPVGITMLVSLK
jgi:hypothetical protein